jgi:hypothetical protein
MVLLWLLPPTTATLLLLLLLLLAGPQLGEGPGQDSIMQHGQLSSQQAQGGLNHCTGALQRTLQLICCDMVSLQSSPAGPAQCSIGSSDGAYRAHAPGGCGLELDLVCLKL